MWLASVWSGLHIILTQILCNYNLLIWNTDAEEGFILIHVGFILIFQITPSSIFLLQFQIFVHSYNYIFQIIIKYLN